MKKKLQRLVGWNRPDGDPVLSSSEAFEVATREVLNALPPCRGRCGCLSLAPPVPVEGSADALAVGAPTS